MLPAVLLVLVISIFYIVTIRTGHHWGDDFALYIHHTRNMAEGIPYTATGYIPNPHVPKLGPLIYPPGFPVLLLPVYKMFGLNLKAMKVEEVVCLAGALLAIFLLFRDRLPYAWNLALVACFGLTPFVWSYRDEVISDVPFLLCIYGSFFLIQRSYDWSKSGPLARAVPIGVCIYFAYAVRPLGLLILPALVIHDFLRHHRITRFVWLTAAITAIPVLVQGLMLPGDTRFGQFSFSPRWLVSDTVTYLKYDRIFWLNGFSNLFSYALFFVVLVLTIVGLRHQIRSGLRIFDLFAAIYLFVVIAYTDPQDRYLIPIEPILLLYAFLGLRRVARVFRPEFSRAIIATAVVAVVFSFGTMYARFGRGPIHEGISDPEFAEVCRYIRGNTQPADVFLFRKPRLLSLLTDRPASIYQPADYAALWDYMGSIQASYLLVADVPEDDFAADRTFLPGFLESRKQNLTRVYQNAHYRIFRLDRTSRNPTPGTLAGHSQANSQGAGASRTDAATIWPGAR